MWAEYRKQFFFTQVVILIVCAAMVWRFQQPWPTTLVTLAVMELFAVVGAAWAARLRRKWTANDDSLPLQR